MLLLFFVVVVVAVVVGDQLSLFHLLSVVVE